MKLEFVLLVVDDEPDNLVQAINILRDHLDAKGFSLKEKEVRTDFSEQGMKNLARSQGKSYDLVMVDYDLGQEGRDGARVAHQLRQELPYVDMVFYSSISVSDLLGRLASHEVSGVFAERRESLDDALIGLADTVIGKAVDLNNMRGIAMAEVAEMDVLMEQTLVRVFQSKNEQVEAAKDRTIEHLQERMEKSSIRLQNRIEEGGLSKVVSDSLLFPLTNKYRAIRRVAKNLSEELRKELEITRSYEEDIIQNRNMLAHVRENVRNDGETVLLSMGRNSEEVVINEAWMTEFRNKLREHKEALDKICNALNGRFGAAETTNQAEKRQA